MDFKDGFQCYKDVLAKYTVFEGRARRREYWMYTLFNIIFFIILAIIDGLIGTNGILPLIYALAVLLPGLAVTIRRLHDTDRVGWWIFICFVPFVGGIILLIFMVLDSTPGDNRYGKNPKHVPEPVAAAAAETEAS